MQYVYVIIDYDTNFDCGNNIIGVHKTRENARKKAENYLSGIEYIEIEEHHKYEIFDEYYSYTIPEDDDVHKCLLVIKAMEVEE